MNKLFICFVGFLVIMGSFDGAAAFHRFFLGEAPLAPSPTTWTKAVCNDNYCMDVEITCRDGNVIAINPLPHCVYYPRDWQYARSEKYENRLC